MILDENGMRTRATVTIRLIDYEAMLEEIARLRRQRDRLRALAEGAGILDES